MEYEELAVNIFSKHEPVNNQVDRIDCFTCEALVPEWYGSHLTLFIYNLIANSLFVGSLLAQIVDQISHHVLYLVNH